MKIKQKSGLVLFFIGLAFSFYSYVSAETISFFADSMTGSASNTKEFSRLMGNAQVKTASIELKASSIELTGKNYRYIRAKGDVSGNYTEEGLSFTCANLSYDRETKTAVLEGKVSMTDTKNKVDLAAELIEYNQNTEIALIQIGVKIVQDKSVCTAAFALYRKKLQIVELSGSPKIVQDNDVFQAQDITFNLDTEEIILDGKVRGTVVDKAADKKEGKNE